MEEGEQYSEHSVERNPRANMSMRDYKNPPWVSAPSYMVPSTNAPYGNAFNLSWGNHTNSSLPQYVPPPHPQSTSPMEEAILNLTKLVGNFVEAQKTINAQLSQKIDTIENNVNKIIDGLQSEMEHKFDNLQDSISRLTNQQHVHQEEVNPEEECLSDTMVKEQCQQQLLLESSDIGAVVYPWEKKEAVPLLRTEEAVEEQNNLPLPPNSVHILPSPASQSQPKTPATETKVIPPLLSILQNFRS